VGVKFQVKLTSDLRLKVNCLLEQTSLVINGLCGIDKSPEQFTTKWDILGHKVSLLKVSLSKHLKVNVMSWRKSCIVNIALMIRFDMMLHY
jgi:hypothetical protein